MMIRETLNPNATDALGFYLYSDGYLLSSYDRAEHRSEQSPTMARVPAKEQPPYWAKLVRSGNTFSAYTSLNGRVLGRSSEQPKRSQWRKTPTSVCS